MRVVIPSDIKDEDADIASLFGMSKYFFIYEVGNEEARLLEVRENQDFKVLRGLEHSRKPPAVQKMIDNLLNDCHVFVAVGINEWVVNNLTARGQKVILTEGGKIRKLVERYSKRKGRKDYLD